MKSKLGYKKGSPYLNEEEIVINSNHITTKDMAFPIMANGIPLFPDTGDYIFQGVDKVIEKPMMQPGGQFSSSLKDQLILSDDYIDNMLFSGPTISKTGPAEVKGFDLKPEFKLPEKAPSDKQKFSPDFVPALGLTNAVLNKFSEYMDKKSKEDEYKRMQTLSNIPATTVLTDTGKYGNPYIMQEGGSFGKAFSEARKQGLKQFEWNGKMYTTKIKEEVEKPNTSEKPKNKSADVKEKMISKKSNINNPYQNYYDANYKKDDKLESGFIVDKRKNKGYIIKKGKVEKEVDVLTGKNPDMNMNSFSMQELEQNPNYRNTPIGLYYMQPNDNIYNMPGFDMLPIKDQSGVTPIAKDLAVHFTYDPLNRNKLYGTDKAKASYGCINCQEPTINKLNRDFPKGDTLQVVDSKLSPAFLKKYYKKGGKIMQEGGRLVTEVPKGYSFLKKEGNRSFYEMQQSIKPAEKGQKGQPKEYESFIMQQVQSGISPEELANKGYISKDNINKFSPYYKRDLVYTEPAPVDEPTPAFRGEPVYEGNKLIGFSRYASRNSMSQADPGSLQTPYEVSEFMFADDMGKPFGEMYSVPFNEWSNTYTGGTRHLKTREGLEKFKSLVKKQMGGITDLSLETVMPSQEFNISPVIKSAPVSTPQSFEPSDIRTTIIKKESSGNYKALPFKNGKLASSAVGAYQFLWNKHKKDIEKVTGVKSKEEFRNNPQAQDTYFDYWDATVLTPTATMIKNVMGIKAPSIDEIKTKVHFAGPKGAKDYFFKGKLTKDAFGTTTASYKHGGEYEMSPEELLTFLQMGGEVEYITE